MDWAKAIERYRQELLAIVEGLFVMIGLTETGGIERLSRPMHRAVLKLLRPAEAAVRRLIIVAAQGLKLKPRAARPFPAGLAKSGKSKGKRRGSFPLFDPRRRDNHGMLRRPGNPAGPRSEPRIRTFDYYPHLPWFLQPRSSAPPPPPQPEPRPKPAPDENVSAAALSRRLAAIREALKDLPRQARRYARWRAKVGAEQNPRHEPVLRRGPPPGLPAKPTHEVHTILKECHWLARTIAASDTS
jgi:hypothetical protein